MSSIYPGGIDSFPTNRVDGTPMATNQAEDHNDYADAINKIEATLGVDPQGTFSTVVERLDTSGSILISSTNVSAAQLLDLDNTAVELLPAPGGRLYYVIHGIVLHYRFVTTPYNEGVQTEFIAGFGSTPTELSSAGLVFLPLAISANAGNLFKKTEDTYVSVPASTTGQGLGSNGYVLPASMLEDKPFAIALDPTFVTPLTGGDSTLTVRVFYSLINGAP